MRRKASGSARSRLRLSRTPKGEAHLFLGAIGALRECCGERLRGDGVAASVEIARDARQHRAGAKMRKILEGNRHRITLRRLVLEPAQPCCPQAEQLVAARMRLESQRLAVNEKRLLGALTIFEQHQTILFKRRGSAGSPRNPRSGTAGPSGGLGWMA